MSTINISKLVMELLYLTKQPISAQREFSIKSNLSDLRNELKKYVHHFEMGANFLVVNNHRLLRFELTGYKRDPKISIQGINHYSHITQINKTQKHHV